MENAQFSAITRGYHNPKLLRSPIDRSIDSLLYRRVEHRVSYKRVLLSLSLSLFFEPLFLVPFIDSDAVFLLPINDSLLPLLSPVSINRVIIYRNVEQELKMKNVFDCLVSDAESGATALLAAAPRPLPRRESR